MTNTKLAVVISDFHVGRGDRLDAFKYDRAFASFCKDLGNYSKTYNVELTLILNGDVLDLWAIVPDSELRPDAGRLVRRNLEFPARSRARRAQAVARGKKQINWALRAHPRVAEGLIALLRLPKTSVIYLPGNHDHAMVHPALQDHFRDAVCAYGGSDAGSRIEFELYHEDEELNLYVDHGNQFSHDSNYQDFTDFGEEAPGFYFVRFVWNRIRKNYKAPTWDPIADAVSWSLKAMPPALSTTVATSTIPSTRCANSRAASAPCCSRTRT